MEPVQSNDSEMRARKAREVALTYRPSDDPLPASVAWKVDCETYWVFALQYFELAEKFYQAGNSKQGDYCIARGNSYVQLASRCTYTASAGVAPLLAEEPADHDPEADPPSRARLEAKLDEIRRLRDPLAPPMPTVFAEASNTPQCDGLYYIAWGHALLASHAYADDDQEMGAYHIHEAQQSLIDWEACKFAADLPQ
jgi:hypothetical protein